MTEKERRETFEGLLRDIPHAEVFRMLFDMQMELLQKLEGMNHSCSAGLEDAGVFQHPPVRTASESIEPIGDDAWSQIWNERLNPILLSGVGYEEVLGQIELLMKENKLPLHMIDFADVGESQRDALYAIFADSSLGNAFLVPSPARNGIFAMYPYPKSSAWFVKGKDTLERAYQVEGEQEAPAPKIEILEAALLMAREGQISGLGQKQMLYEPIRRGRMRVTR